MMEAPRTLRTFADRPSTGQGIIYRSNPSPARVSRSEARFTKPDENSRFAAFVPGAESAPVQYVSTGHGDWARAKVIHVDHGHAGNGVKLDKPNGSVGKAVGGTVWLSPNSERSMQHRFAPDSEKAGEEVKSRPLTIFPAPRLSAKAVSSPTAQTTVGTTYLIQPPCASMSPKRQSMGTEVFGGLDTAVGSGYVIQAPSTSVRPIGSPKEAFGTLETQVGASYLIQAPRGCASTSSKGKSVESPKEAFSGLESPAAEESAESPKCSTSPQAKSHFKCPECNAIVSSMDEALKHCGTLNGDGGQASSPSSLPTGEAVAFDEHGKMLIVRVTQPTGERETVVRLPDGQQRTFDESSVKKMLGSSQKEIAQFLEDLSNTELRGLVHEVGQRLLEGSQLYHSRLAELDRLGEMSNLKFFDLDETATSRDLDNAYRKLAKKMHPDKNGGTEAAKQRFQAMKERYEALKKKLAEDNANAERESEGEEVKKEDSKDGKEEKEKKEDSKDDAKSIEYDPSNKESMVSTVVRMASQLKNIDVQMAILLKELSRMSHPQGT